MLCRATVVRFYNGVLVGPETGHDTVDYTGLKKERPEDFVVVTSKMKESADKEQTALEKKQKEDSAGLPFDSTDKSLPVSGGVKSSPKNVGRVDSVNESADELLGKKAVLGEDGKPLGPDYEIES